MSDLIPVNPFDQALETLKKDFPAKFALEVEDHVFRDLPSYGDAEQLAGAMERMKVRAVQMGYTVTTTYDNKNFRWVYGFELRAGFSKPGDDSAIKLEHPLAQPDPVAQLPEPEPAIEEEKPSE